MCYKENYLNLKFYSAFILGVRLDRVRGGRQKYRRCQESPYQVHPIACKKPSLEGDFLKCNLKNPTLLSFINSARYVLTDKFIK